MKIHFYNLLVIPNGYCNAFLINTQTSTHNSTHKALSAPSSFPNLRTPDIVAPHVVLRVELGTRLENHGDRSDGRTKNLSGQDSADPSETKTKEIFLAEDITVYFATRYTRLAIRRNESLATFDETGVQFVNENVPRNYFDR